MTCDVAFGKSNATETCASSSISVGKKMVVPEGFSRGTSRANLLKRLKTLHTWCFEETTCGRKKIISRAFRRRWKVSSHKRAFQLHRSRNWVVSPPTAGLVLLSLTPFRCCIAHRQPEYCQDGRLCLPTPYPWCLIWSGTISLQSVNGSRQIPHFIPCSTTFRAKRDDRRSACQERTD